MANLTSQKISAKEDNQHSKKSRAKDDDGRDGATSPTPPTIAPDPNYTPPSRGGDGNS